MDVYIGSGSDCLTTMLKIFDGGDVSRRPNPLPRYVLHSSGRARIYFDKEFRYLPGPYGSPESWARFHELCEVVAATGKLPPDDAKKQQPLTVQELGYRYLTYCVNYYGCTANRNEAVNLKYAVESLTLLFGSRLADSITPSDLKAVRKALINKGHVRRSINKRAVQIVALYKWAVEEGLVPADVWHRLQAVKTIAPGREGAVDNEPVEPVPENVLAATLAELPADKQAAIRVQRLTGMRSGELLRMTPAQVDMTGQHWIYTLDTHKTRAHIGDTYILIPAPAAAILLERMPAKPDQPWFGWSVGWQAKSVAQAAIRAGVPHWHPHQLRHNLATEIAERIGLEAAQKVLRHTNPKMTKTYARDTIDGLKAVADRLYGVIGNG